MRRRRLLFLGDIEKNCSFLVVFEWSKRGEPWWKRGEIRGRCEGLKITPRVSSIFSGPIR